jgi:hypothetical protein
VAAVPGVNSLVARRGRIVGQTEVLERISSYPQTDVGKSEDGTRVAAGVIVSEIGVDMTRFATARRTRLPTSLPTEWWPDGFILETGRFRRSHDLIIISVSFGDEAIVRGVITAERTITQFLPRVLAV